MVDTCVINKAGETTWVNGAYVETPGAQVYSGKCQIQVTDSINVQGENVGEQRITTERVTLKIPVSAPAVPINSVATITAVAPVSDPALVGRKYRVTGSHAATFKTARRLPVELVTP